MDVNQILSRLTLRQKIAQTFLQYYQGYDDLPPRLQELNRKGELGNILFFSGANVRNLDQLHGMCTAIQSHAAENPHQIPFLITIDQEGGQLTAIHRGTSMFPGNMALGFANDASLAEAQGHHVGKELRYAGINLCYAPVLDVSYDSQSVPIVDNRMYSSKPEVVADMGTGFIRGLMAEGVSACGKHFPGMRLTQEDTHFQCDSHPGDMKRLLEVELRPYQKAIAAGLDTIMTHHGVFPALDGQYPASMSEKWYSYLRHEMGFTGLTVTDDLIMGAVRSQYGDEESVIIALNAGADLLMHTALSATYVDIIEKAINDGRVKVGRVEEACRRVLAHKAKYCTPVPATPGFRKEDGDRVALDIARKSLVRHKGAPSLFPLKLTPETTLGIVFANPARLVMSDAINLYDPLSVAATVTKVTGHRAVKEAFMPWRPTHMEQVSVGDIPFISDLALFTTVNAYAFEEQIETLKYVRQICPTKVIVGVATRSPADAKLLEPYCDAVIVTGGLSQVTLDALVEALFVTGRFDENPAKVL
jgi:beta-N-acetylhexosaminidase